MQANLYGLQSRSCMKEATHKLSIPQSSCLCTKRAKYFLMAEKMTCVALGAKHSNHCTICGASKLIPHVICWTRISNTTTTPQPDTCISSHIRLAGSKQEWNWDCVSQERRSTCVFLGLLPTRTCTAGMNSQAECQQFFKGVPTSMQNVTALIASASLLQSLCWRSYHGRLSQSPTQHTHKHSTHTACLCRVRVTSA